MLNKKQLNFIRTKLKTEEKTMTLQQIKNDIVNLGKICLNSGVKIEFGKPVKLPIIKKKKDQIVKTVERCDSQEHNQNNSQLDLYNNLKENSLENLKIQDSNKNYENYQLNLMNQLHLKNTIRDRSLDMSNINVSALEQTKYSFIHDEKNEKQIKKKCFPKIFRYKYFKDQELFGNIKSERNVTKIQQLQSIPKYQLDRLLGQGSFATVRIGISKENQKQYAIKTYQKCKILENQKKQNINRQINILQRINHPNIIKFIQVIQTNLSINIVTQYIENISLYDYLKNKNGKKLPEHKAKMIFKQIASAISYLHGLEITHRDIKLQNILITKDRQIKLIDFGFSIQGSNKINFFCGTPSYLSPEIISKKGYFAKPTDIWSCGIVLYKMLCGCFPFKGINSKTLYNKISKGSFTMTSEISLNAQILLNKMLTIDPNERITISQVLESKWMKDTHTSSKEITIIE